MAAGAVTEYSLGRHFWGISGTPGLWSGDIHSSHNSQFLFDPYTFTHITHGILFFILLSLVFGRLPVSTRLIIVVGLEVGWEVLENTDRIIQRYRAETISLNYFGDSILNSMGDIAACVFGFLLASRLSRRTAIAVVIVMEILLLIFVRDNLTINILMLIRPSRAIRMWQTGS